MGKLKKILKRTVTLFVYIKDINKKFVEKDSKKKGMNNSQYVDALIDQERKLK